MSLREVAVEMMQELRDRVLVIPQVTERLMEELEKNERQCRMLKSERETSALDLEALRQQLDLQRQKREKRAYLAKERKEKAEETQVLADHALAEVATKKKRLELRLDKLEQELAWERSNCVRGQEMAEAARLVLEEHQHDRRAFYKAALDAADLREGAEEARNNALQEHRKVAVEVRGHVRRRQRALIARQNALIRDRKTMSEEVEDIVALLRKRIDQDQESQKQVDRGRVGLALKNALDCAMRKHQDVEALSSVNALRFATPIIEEENKIIGRGAALERAIAERERGRAQKAKEEMELHKKELEKTKQEQGRLLAWSAGGLNKEGTVGQPVGVDSSASPRSSSGKPKREDTSKVIRTTTAGLGRSTTVVAEGSSNEREVPMPDLNEIPERYQKVVKQAAERGWNKMKWTGGKTLLHYSAQRALVNWCEYFMYLKADPNAQDDKGQSALDAAIAKGNKECIELLRKGLGGTAISRPTEVTEFSGLSES